MKKVICVLCIILFAATISSAATLSRLGFKGGLNFSSVNGDDLIVGASTTKTYSWGSKMGYGGGFFVTVNFNDKFSVQPEILLTRKKVKVDGTEDTYLKMTYTEIPVLLSYTFRLENRLEPSLYFGPYLGLKNKMQIQMDSTVRANVYADEDISITGPIQADLKNAKSVDYGIVFGAGTAYEFDFGTLLIDFRYCLGLTKLFGKYQDGWNLLDETNEGLDIKNNSIMIFLGITL